MDFGQCDDKAPVHHSPPINQALWPDKLHDGNKSMQSSTMAEAEKKRLRGLDVDEAYEKLEKHSINRRRVVFLKDELRRSGGYGVVRRAALHRSAYLPAWLSPRFTEAPQIVAVKQIQISATDHPTDLKRAFTKELLVWSSLDAHPGIAKFLGFHADLGRSEAWLVSPWEPYGNIAEFLGQRVVEVPEKLSLAHDTIDALNFLHHLNPPVCHGDVKSANVLVNVDHRAVLCDFGLARLYEDSGFERLETSTGFKGSIRWCSPELLRGARRNPNSDVYAWAWLVWEIMTGELPYHGITATYAIMYKIFESPRPLFDGESCLSDCLQLWELMTRCWDAEPAKRPNSSMCLTTVNSLPHCPPIPTNVDPESCPARLLEHLGIVERWKGKYRKAVACLEKALQSYEAEGNADGVARVLCKQAYISLCRSNHVKAYEFASAALERCRTCDDQLGAADASYWVYQSLAFQNKGDEAMPFLRESLKLFRAHHHDVGVVKCLERQGEIHRSNLRFDDALSTLEEAVTIAMRSGDRLGEAQSLLIIGCTQSAQRKYAEGAATLSTVCDIARRIGWKGGVCQALSRLGDLNRESGNNREAEEFYRQSLTIDRRGRLSHLLAQTLYNLAQLLYDEGRLDEASLLLEESCSVYRDISYRGTELADALSLLGDVMTEQGRQEEALHLYERAIIESVGLQDKLKITFNINKKAITLKEMERYDEAALHVEACMILADEQGDEMHYPLHQGELASFPKSAMQWEPRWCPEPGNLDTCPRPSTDSPSCDLGSLQARRPQLFTPHLKFVIQPR